MELDGFEQQSWNQYDQDVIKTSGVNSTVWSTAKPIRKNDQAADQRLERPWIEPLSQWWWIRRSSLKTTQNNTKKEATLKVVCQRREGRQIEKILDEDFRFQSVKKRLEWKIWNWLKPSPRSEGKIDEFVQPNRINWIESMTRCVLEWVQSALLPVEWKEL